MNQSIKHFLGGMLLLVMPLMMTSCEGTLDDVFGEWSRPTQKVPSSAEEDARVLGAALKTGAIVTINYSVGTKTYKATFTKNSDDSYTLNSNEDVTPSGARAMTRTAVAYIVPTGNGTLIGSNIQLVLVGGKLQLTVKDTQGTPLFEAQMNIEGGEVVVLNTNAGGIDCNVISVSADDKPLEIKKHEMLSVNIEMEPIKYPVKFSEGETWADVVVRNKKNDVVEIATTTDGYISVKLSKVLVVNAFTEKGTEQANAEKFYDSEYSATFYLINLDPDDYVKAVDPVDSKAHYSLGTAAPMQTED